MIRNQAVSSRSRLLVKAALPPIDSESSDSENDSDPINTISKNQLDSENSSEINEFSSDTSDTPSISNIEKLLDIVNMPIFDEIGNPFDVGCIENDNVIEPPLDLTIFPTPENLITDTNHSERCIIIQYQYLDQRNAVFRHLLNKENQ
jgi:hypothetical protein